jgi:tetratricopeptide (TPR) repeat protein
MATTTAPTTWPLAPRVRWHQLWQLPAFCLGIVTLSAVLALRPLWQVGPAVEARRALADARRLAEHPDTRPEDLDTRLTALLAAPERFPTLAGEAHFLLGSVYLRHAGAEPEAWRRARAHLENAEALGVPDAVRARLTFRLGKVWAHDGVDPRQVCDYLARSVPDAADDPFEGYGLLTQAYLHLPEADVQAALDANKKQLDLPTAREDLLAPVRLLRGELLLRVQNPVGAREVVKFIKSPAPAPLIAQARYLEARTYQDEEQWQKAAQHWEESLEQPGVGDPGLALYNLGVCYRRLDQPRDAARVWERVLDQDPGDLAPAAALGLAELRLAEPNPQAALDAFARAVRDTCSPDDWKNTRVDLARAREAFERGCALLQACGQPDLAVQLARLYERIAPPGAAAYREAQAAEAAAQDRLKRVEAGQGGQPLEEQARQLFALAGRQYEAAAEGAGPADVMAERLRSSAECYFKGQDHGSAIPVLQRLVKLRLPADRQGQVWFLLAEAHRAMQQEDDALQEYDRCAQCPGPYAYRARYHLARALIAGGKWEDAATALAQNLELMRREPDAEAQEKSLYELANVLIHQHQDLHAVPRLKEALELYPNSLRATGARFQYADCCRRLANREALALGNGEEPGPELLQHRQGEYRSWMARASAGFDDLVREFDQRLATGPVTEEDELLYYQAAWASADCRMRLGDANGAVVQYENLFNRLHHRVEGLYGLVAVARYWSDKHDPERYRAYLNRIRKAMDALDDTAFPTGPGAWDRAKWEEWLTRCQTNAATP